jgi:hypothetical protein
MADFSCKTAIALKDLSVDDDTCADAMMDVNQDQVFIFLKIIPICLFANCSCMAIIQDRDWKVITLLQQGSAADSSS